MGLIMQELADFIVRVKRKTNIANYSVTTDQITLDILGFINDRRARMWRKSNWDFGRKAFTIPILATVTDYNIDSTIGKIETISNGNNDELIRRSPRYYHKWLFDQNGNSTGNPRYYIPIGNDSEGTISIRIFPTPSESLTLYGFGIKKLTEYSISDIATNPKMDFFSNDFNDILFLGVVADIYEQQKLNDLSRAKDVEFEAKLNLAVPEVENTPDKPYTWDTPSYIKSRNIARKNGSIC